MDNFFRVYSRGQVTASYNLNLLTIYAVKADFVPHEGFFTLRVRRSPKGLPTSADWENHFQLTPEDVRQTIESFERIVQDIISGRTERERIAGATYDLETTRAMQAESRQQSYERQT